MEAQRKFKSRLQKEDKSLYLYAAELATLAREAFPGAGDSLLDEFVSRQFLSGIRDPRLRDKLAFHNPCSMPALLAESDKITSQFANVDALTSLHRNNGDYRPRDRVGKPGEAESPRSVQFRTADGKPTSDHGVTEVKCYGCGSPGHRRNECPSRLGPDPGKVPSNSRPTVNNVEGGLSFNKLSGKCLINGQEATYLLDTGADVTLLNESIRKRLRVRLLGSSQDYGLRMADRTPLPVRGEAEVGILLAGH